jgi:hypothetical protein
VFNRTPDVTALRASEIARRRTEEERAEAFFPLRARTTAADSNAMREQLSKSLVHGCERRGGV